MSKARRLPAVVEAQLLSLVAGLAKDGYTRADFIAALKNPTPKPTPIRRRGRPQKSSTAILVQQMIRKMEAGGSRKSASDAVAREATDEDALPSSVARRLRRALAVKAAAAGPTEMAYLQTIGRPGIGPLRPFSCAFGPQAADQIRDLWKQFEAALAAVSPS